MLGFVASGFWELGACRFRSLLELVRGFAVWGLRSVTAISKT